MLWQHSRMNVVTAFDYWWSWQINKIHDAMYHKLLVLMQTLWELYPWHIDSGIKEWKNRGKYRRILLTVHYRSSLTWKNIGNLIVWEKYNTGGICTLFLMPALPDSTTFYFRSGKIEMHSLKVIILWLVNNQLVIRSSI